MNDPIVSYRLFMVAGFITYAMGSLCAPRPLLMIPLVQPRHILYTHLFLLLSLFFFV